MHPLGMSPSHACMHPSLQHCSSDVGLSLSLSLFSLAQSCPVIRIRRPIQSPSPISDPTGRRRLRTTFILSHYSLSLSLSDPTCVSLSALSLSLSLSFFVLSLSPRPTTPLHIKPMTARTSRRGAARRASTATAASSSSPSSESPHHCHQNTTTTTPPSTRPIYPLSRLK